MASKVAVYLRVSSLSQREDSQREAVDAWLKAQRVSDAVYYVDKGKSGMSMKRPAFEKLQADIAKRRVATVVVYRLDRISRNLRDGINCLCDWLEGGTRIVAVSQNLDFAGITGKLVASVLFAVAQMESEVRAERQALGIAVAKRKGVYQGRKPGTFKASPQRARELATKGNDLSEIAAALKISVSSARRYLACETSS